MSERTCPRTVNDGKDRCPWRGDEPEAHDDHNLCLLGGHFLHDGDVRFCGRCVTRTLTDLDEIVTAWIELETVVSTSGYRMRGIPGGDALVMLAAGSLEGGGPDDHIRFRDPVPVLVALHFWERDWRETFGHSHYPRWKATVTSVTGYLREWTWLAARTHDAFDDYAREVRTLRSRLQHVAGLANDPYRMPAECFDCHGPLLREYRKPATATTGRLGHDGEGLTDDMTCRDCGRVYRQADYGYALLALAASCSGWVTVRMAADAARRPERTIWTWLQRGEITAACRLSDRRLIVEWDEVAQHATRSGCRALAQRCA